jgi:hypothetical protein
VSVRLAYGIQTSIPVANAAFSIQLNYAQFDYFLKPLDGICFCPRYKLDQLDVGFLAELPLLFHGDTIHLTFKLIHNMVHISDTPDGGCSLTIT